MAGGQSLKDKDNEIDRLTQEVRMCNELLEKQEQKISDLEIQCQSSNLELQKLERIA